LGRDDVEPGLAGLAYTMLEQGRYDEPVQRRQARAILVPHVVPDDSQVDAVLSAAHDLRFVRVTREHPHRLRPHVRDRIEFEHHRWQEFWAALQLDEEQTPAGTPFTDADWRRFLLRFWYESEMPNRQQSGVGEYGPLPPPPPTGWEEVILLLAGFHPRPDDFVRSLLPVNPVMAARCIHDGRANVGAGVVDQVRRALRGIMEDTTQGIALRTRIAAGDAWGYLLDWPWRERTPTDPIAPEMVELPGTRSFLMGTTDEDRKRYERQLGKEYQSWEYEQPAHKVALGPFRIGRYPVTCREYERFVNDGGYQEARWWTQAGREWLRGGQDDDPRTAPRHWEDPRFRQPNRPVVGVTWYEAVAYCNWLTAERRSVAPGGRYRLPTEAEWEYAARGNERRLWPWGDEPPPTAENASTRCNASTGDNQVSRTTPVGIYPLGRTPEGIEDLSGNVLEWCSSLHEPYPYSASDGREDVEAGENPVFRGGSWLNLYTTNCRCAFVSLFNVLLLGCDDHGFRCAVSRPDST
jgi:formylglycine-generating enzyme required for sulfatase activity